MRKRGYWIKQSIAIVISVAMLFNSVEMPVLAEEAENENMMIDGERAESVLGAEEAEQEKDDAEEAEEKAEAPEKDEPAGKGETESVGTSEAVENGNDQAVKEDNDNEENNEQIASDESQAVLTEDSKEEEYEISTEWELMESARGSMNEENIEWTLDNEGTLTISGDGKMEDFDSSADMSEWREYKADIKNVVIESGVTSIGAYAFSDCSNLTDIKIKGHIESLNLSMFSGCTALKNLAISGSVGNIDAGTFSSKINLEHVSISKIVGNIGMSAFNSCSSLSDLTIKETGGSTSLGVATFQFCTSLTSITLPAGVTNIGISNFYGCSSLKSVTIPDTVTSIENTAFWHCTSLEDICIPDSVTQMDHSMFASCLALKSMRLPNNLESISHNLFDDCSALRRVIIPKSVTSIEKDAFSGCSSLTDIYYSGTEEEWNRISIDVNNGVLTNAKKHFENSVSWQFNKTTGALTVSGNGEMYNFDSATDVSEWRKYITDIKSVVVESGVTSIGSYAFNGCTNLSDVKIVGNITKLGSNAFDGCFSLGSVEIDGDVETIESGAFNDCTSMTRLKIGGDVGIINANVFSNGALDDLTIEGQVERIDTNGLSGDIRNITIQNGVETIEVRAFSGCKLEKLVICGDVGSIGIYAFDGCKSLQSIEIYGDVGGIGRHPGSYNSVVFSGCSSLECVKINGNVGYIGDYSFISHTKLKRIEINGDINAIGEYAFRGCSALETIELTNVLESIGKGAFHSCSTLKTVIFSGTVGNIENDAFNNCKALERITLPNSVMTIGVGAFDVCSSLSDVYYEGSEDDWASITIGSNNDGLTNATIHYGTPRLAAPTATYESGSTVVKGSTVELHAEEGAVIYYTTGGKTPTTGSTEYTAPISIDKDVTIKAIAVKDRCFNSKVAVFSYTVKEPEPEPEPEPDPVDYGDIEEQDKPAAAEENRTDTYWIAGVYDTEYTGKAVTFDDLRVYYGNKLLTKGKDYTVKYKDNTQVGTASVTITGKGNYSGSKTFTFKITAAKSDGTPIDKATVKNWKSSQVYTGSALTESAEVSVNGTSQAAGTAIKTAGGTAQTQAAGAILTLNGKQLVEGKDYKVEYKGNVNVGTATVLFRGIGDYRGTVQKKFKITARSIADGKVLTSECDPTAPVSKSGAKPNITVKHNGKVLKEGKDYTLAFKNNKKVGATATYTIKGKGNFKGSVKAGEFKVVEQSIAGMTVNVPDVTYKNKAKIYKSKPTVCDTDGKKLKAGTDYEKTYAYTYVNDTKIGGTTVPAGTAVSDTDIIPAGTEIRVTVTGKGSYGKDSATVSGTFRIIDAEKTIARATVKITEDVYYTGKPVTLEKSQISVTVKGTALKAEEFEIVPDSYVNNTKKGTAKVTIHGTGAYGGTKTVKFKIKAKSIK